MRLHEPKARPLHEAPFYDAAFDPVVVQRKDGRLKGPGVFPGDNVYEAIPLRYEDCARDELKARENLHAESPRPPLPKTRVVGEANTRVVAEDLGEGRLIV